MNEGNAWPACSSSGASTSRPGSTPEPDLTSADRSAQESSHASAWQIRGSIALVNGPGTSHRVKPSTASSCHSTSIFCPFKVECKLLYVRQRGHKRCEVYLPVELLPRNMGAETEDRLPSYYLRRSVTTETASRPKTDSAMGSLSPSVGLAKWDM